LICQNIDKAEPGLLKGILSLSHYFKSVKWQPEAATGSGNLKRKPQAEKNRGKKTGGKPVNDGNLLTGWEAIAKYVERSSRGLRNRRAELLAQRVVFYRRNRNGKRIVCAWSQDLRQWAKSECSFANLPG
jgi:hypothetical protein